MKRVIIIFFFILVLCGAGAAAVYYRVGPLAQIMDSKLDTKQKLAALQISLPPPLPIVTNIDSIVVPIIVNRDISREVGIDTAIVIQPSFAGAVRAMMPKLQDAYTTTLFQMVPRLADPFSADSKQAIHDRLLQIAQQIDGADAIADVTVKNIYPR